MSKFDEHDRPKENEPVKGEFSWEFSLSKILSFEIIRYKRKGRHLITSILLNVVFFYFMPTLLNDFTKYFYKGKDDGYFHTFATLFIHLLTWVIINLYYITLYYFQFEFTKKYKVSPAPWPWELKNWPETLRTTILVLFLNIFIILPLFMCIYIYLDLCPHNLDTSTIPSGFQIFLECIFCALCDDFYIYFAHRLLHASLFYGPIHKLHHTYKTSPSFSAEFAHPLEFSIGNLMSSSFGSMILGKNMHYSSYLSWVIYIAWESHEIHSGYEFPISMFDIVPMTNPAEFHLYHHAEVRGNYGGMFFFWDRALNSTNSVYMNFFMRSAEEYPNHDYLRSDLKQDKKDK